MPDTFGVYILGLTMKWLEVASAGSRLLHGGERTQGRHALCRSRLKDLVGQRAEERAAR